VGDHYTALVSDLTNTVVVGAGVAKYAGSFTLTTISAADGAEYTNSSYIGYSGNNAVTYGTDSGTNGVEVFVPPLVTMAESALASLGTRFSGTSWSTNSYSIDSATVSMVTEETLSGVVSSTGTVSVAAGTFSGCLASLETQTSIYTTIVMGYTSATSTNTFTQIRFLAPNIGCIKIIGEDGSTVYELLGGVIGGVTIGTGGGGDTQPPSLSITSPPNGTSFTVSSVTVQGTAWDNVGVAGVYCRVGGNSWSAAQGTTNWSFLAALAAGTNSIEAYAADAAGNLSTTDKVSVVYSAPAASGMLYLETNGLGTITGNFKGYTLQVGESYTITAVPGAGQVFAGWTGDIQTNQNPLTFVMPVDLTLRANFKANSFAAAKGVYSGLFFGTNAVEPNNSGAFTLAVTDKGSYTGTLLLGGGSLRLSGSFDGLGAAQQAVSQPKQGSVAVNLQLDMLAGQQVTGTVQGNGWGAELLGYPSVFDAKTNPAPLGNYTFVLAGFTNPSVAPAGWSFGTASVTAGGQVSFSATLADGTSAAQSAALCGKGLWPFYVSLYQGKGLVMGWVGATNHTPTGMNIQWVKAAGAAGTYYPNGFAFETGLTGYKYTPPSANQPMINWNNALVALEDGNLAAILTNTVTVNSKNQVQVAGANGDKLTLALMPATGAFKGSFQPPGASKPWLFNGVVLTGLEWAGGFFLGPNQSGSVSIGKP
jgi:uncharacterized repeat protein (TIGR02543 family)